MNPLDLSHIHGPAGTGSGRMSVYNRIVASHLAQSIPQHTTKLLRKASNLTLTGSISGRGQNSGGVYGGLQTPGFLPSGPPSPAVPRRISYAPASHPNHQPTTSSTSAATQTQPSNQLITHPAGYGGHDGSGGAPKETGVTAYHLTPDELSRAIADTVSALRHEGVAAAHGGHGGADHGGESGGHDAPSWSRFTSASVLLACTALYAAIAGKKLKISLIVPNDLTHFCYCCYQKYSWMWWMLSSKGLESTKSSWELRFLHWCPIPPNS